MTNWMDIVVSGAGESERRVCERILVHKRRDLFDAQFHVEIERACTLEPLPTVPADEGGGYVLVDPRAIGPSELARMDALGVDEKTDGGDGAPQALGPIMVTTFSRADLKARCGQMLVKLLMARVPESSRRSTEDSSEFLDTQIDIVESFHVIARAAYERKAVECEGIEGAMTKAERACYVNPAQSHCARFHPRTIGLELCEVARDRFASGRGDAERAIKLLRDMKAQPPQVTHRPVCRPES
ncbi:hypothetical protein LVJ94_28435 [Pendulispora rubella]|uniref:Uncharacterized protein n=1 Tax=Pendulispora rubella TaxID=2741070 RepID=A0ABZ2KT01_9BACT